MRGVPSGEDDLAERLIASLVIGEKSETGES